MKTKVLVTGGLGYIGSHTVVELINANYQPIIADNLSNSKLGMLKQIKAITGVSPDFYKIDLCDEKLTAELVASEKDLDSVIHFAAYKAVGESVAEPLKYYSNNFNSLLSVLKAFERRPLKLVFSSSCTVYGQPDSLPVNEFEAVKLAESPYGNTKQVAEEILKDIAGADKTKQIISLRYFNPVGAHESALIGELPLGIPQNLVPFVTQSAIGKRGPITVFGNDYDTRDGSCIRDYIHVVDLAQAHIAALRFQEDGVEARQNFNTFNVGTGKGCTVLEVIKAFEKATGVSLNFKFGARRAGDIEKIWGDATKAQNELKWEAKLDLEEMMKSAWAWEQYLENNKID